VHAHKLEAAGDERAARGVRLEVSLLNEAGAESGAGERGNEDGYDD
jgi:hypothetical protein